LIAYDSAGNAIGSAKVVKDSDTAMTVTLSKDTNVALRSASEIGEQNGTTSADGKGKTEGSSPTGSTTEGGKTDEVAPSQKTADTVALPLYGILGGLSTLLLAVAMLLKKRFWA
jgi:hypothetical protein